MSPKLKLREIEENLETSITFSPVESDLVANTGIQITLEEYEAIRLYYYDFIDRTDKQMLCAKQLNVSQPTFSRILKKGLERLIDAIVEKRTFTISGGENLFQKEWKGWGCWECSNEWQQNDKPEKCPNCGSTRIFTLKRMKTNWET